MSGTIDLDAAYIGDSGDTRTLNLEGIEGGTVSSVLAVLKRDGVTATVTSTAGAIFTDTDGKTKLPVTMPLGAFLTGGQVAAGGTPWLGTFEVSFSSGDELTWGTFRLPVRADPNPS